MFFPMPLLSLLPVAFFHLRERRHRHCFHFVFPLNPGLHMSSPFHTVMTTPVLDVRELARLMHEQAASVRDEDASRVADATLLGKLAMLDALAARMWSVEMTATETAELQAAANEVGRAMEVLAGSLRVDG